MMNKLIHNLYKIMNELLYYIVKYFECFANKCIVFSIKRLLNEL